MNLKKSLKLSCTLSIDFVEFSLKFKQIIILIFHSSFWFFFHFNNYIIRFLIACCAVLYKLLFSCFETRLRLGDRDQKSFLMVQREKMKLTLVENSR